MSDNKKPCPIGGHYATAPAKMTWMPPSWRAKFRFSSEPAVDYDPDGEPGDRQDQLDQLATQCLSEVDDHIDLLERIIHILRYALHRRMTVEEWRMLFHRNPETGCSTGFTAELVDSIGK